MQSVVPQQPTTSKQSVIQQPTTSNQSVVPQQPTTTKISWVLQQPTTSKQSVIQQPTTSNQSVVPQQPTTTKISLVLQQPTTSKESVVPQQPTTIKISLVLQRTTTSKESVVPQQPTTTKISLVPQQPTTSKQTVVPQQPTTSKQSVIQQPTTSNQSVVPQQPTTTKISLVPQQPTTSKQSVISVTQLPLVTKQLITQRSVKPTVACQSPHKQNVTNCCKSCNSVLSDNGDCQTCYMSKLKGIIVTGISVIDINQDKDQSKDKEHDKDKDTNKEKDKDEDNMLTDEPVCVISSDDEDCDSVEPQTSSYGDHNEELNCKQFAEFKNEDYESYPLTDEHLDDRIVTPVKICDYRRLNIDKFVNDTIVEFYLNYWYCRKLSLEDRMRTYLFDTFFYTSLTRKVFGVKIKSRHDRVKSRTKKVNIFEKDFIFIPINENLHWFMAVICYPHLTGPVHFEDGTQLETLYEDDFGDYERPSPKPCEPNADRDEADGNTEDLRYYPDFSHDGKSTGNYQSDVENLKKKNRIPIKQPVILIFDSLNGHTARARIVATLREWLSEEYRTKHNGSERDFSLRAMKGTVVKVPQQPNYTDCGLFVMHYFQKFFECPIIDYSCPILHLENWFSIDVSKNCLKRREVQSIILKVMNEQGRSLPSGIMLPELRFSKPEQKNNVLIQSLQFQNNVQHYQQYYHNDQGGDIIMELDNVDEEMNEYHQEDMETSQDDDSQEEGDYQSNYRSDFDMKQSNSFNMPSYNEYYYEEVDEDEEEEDFVEEDEEEEADFDNDEDSNDESTNHPRDDKSS